MPFTKVYLHIVWSTKKREHFLSSKELRKKIVQHIIENAKLKSIFIDYIYCCSDHCHCLILLGIDQSIQKIVQLIKGESSYWINKNNLIIQKFEWQDEYFVVSVSESMIETVRNYIKNQEEHHKRKTFEQEYNEFISKYKFD